MSRTPLAGHHLSKRTAVVAALSALLAALTLAACGSSSSDSTGGSGGGSATAPEGKEFSGKSVTMVTYGGETETALEEAIADPFSEETGATVVQEAPLDYAKIEAQQQAGDVSWDDVTSEPFVTAGRCGDLYEPLKNVDVSQIDPKYITDKCSVPADVYSAVILYNKEEFGDDPPQGWKDFFDTEKYPGKRAVWSYVGGNALEAALLGDGVPKNQLYPLDVNRAIEKLESLGGDLTYYSDLAQGPEMLLSGQASMVMSYNTRAYVAVNDAPDTIGVQWNEDILSWDAWAMPKGVSDPEVAESLLNYIAKPTTQQDVAKVYPYGSAAKNPDYSGVSPEIMEYIPTTPEREKEAVFADPKWYAKHFDEANEAFTTLQAG